ncbi:MAG: NAD(P)H-dependent oxidoreductase [Gammaproteobacteria bacterium]|nr:MAG: NAD(P)H-dependent oxidoreductase [Gammaproteobacteria bacterium]
MKLLGLSGGLSQQTIITIEKALDFAYQYDNSITIEALNISEYDIQYCDGRDPTKYEGDTQYVIENIIEADALFIGTPMYRGSYTGMLKNMFDILPNDALLGKPVGLIATGGSDHHYLALEQELRPLLSFFYAFGVPGCVYANNNHFSERDLICNETLDRLKQLAKAVVNLERILPTDKTNIIGPMGPSLYKQKHLAPRLKIVR